jgi:DNA-binding NtrC family response regulator
VKIVNEKHFEVELPEEVLAGFGWQEAEVPRRVREALVMELLRLDRLSEAEAAQFLGLNRDELLETMGRYQVPAIQMSPQELKEELSQDIKRGDQP